MQQLKRLMEKKGLSHIYWNMHLLKSKAVSDAEDKRIAGHKSEAMCNRYDTKKHNYKPPK